MAEDIDTILQDGEEKKESPAEARIKDLSNKVKLTAQERDELAKSKAEVEKGKADAEKRADFYKNAAKLSGKYPNAADHLEEIEAKVMAGYDPEDATVSVLAKAGKLTTSATPVERDTIAGGSAQITPPSKGGTKSFGEMSQEERRAELLKREQEGGELSHILEQKSLV